MLLTMVIHPQKIDKKLLKKYKILIVKLDSLLAHHKPVVMVLHLQKLIPWFIIQTAMILKREHNQRQE